MRTKAYGKLLVVGAAAAILSGNAHGAMIGSQTGDEDSYNNNAHMSGSRFLASETFTATEMKAYLVTPGGKLHMAIYGDTNGLPSYKLGETEQITSTVSGWNSAELTSGVQITEDNYYWLLFNNDNASQAIGLNWGVQQNQGKDLRIVAFVCHGAF